MFVGALVMPMNDDALVAIAAGMDVALEGRLPPESSGATHQPGDPVRAIRAPELIAGSIEG